MTSAVEGSPQEDLEHPLDHLPTGQALRERDDVGVVVAARELGRIRLRNRSASYARHLVRGHRDAEARSADQDAALGLSRRNRLADRVAKLRIIDRRRVVRAEIEYLVSSIAQDLRDVIFVFETGVIGAEGDLHLFSNLRRR